MKTLSKQNAQDIINWYNSYAADKQNWGSWTNYPELPVGASYLQYDDCNCVVKLDEPCRLEGDDFLFKYITDSRKAPGKGNKLSFSELADFAKTNEERQVERIEGIRENYRKAKSFEAQQTQYEAQSDQVKRVIADLMAESNAILGTPNSRSRQNEISKDLSNYILPVFNEKQPWAFGADGWVTKALQYNNEEDYIANQLANKL